MPLKREIIAVMPLRNFPGHWLLQGKTEGEYGTWHVIRKPNGTYWAAMMPVSSDNGGVIVEIGDKITDARAVAEFESGFVNLWHTPASTPPMGKQI